MKRSTLCLSVLMLLALFSQAQSRYVIKFRDKGTNPYALNNPIAYLSQRAIDRRLRYAIPIDSTDLPVTPRYIDSIRLSGTVTILNASKWLNSVTIQTTDAAALAKINSFPFVQSANAIASRIAGTGGKDKFKTIGQVNPVASREMDINADFFNYGSSFAQVHLHNGEFLHNIGLRGQGMIIGMMDGGFQNYLTVKAFDSARNNSQVLGTWDFVAREQSVNEDDAHGMECFSVIASNIPGSFVGTAPKANFYLFRSEDVSSEYPIEEHNWVCAAERVDSSGGDVISSSLGYADGMSDPAFNHSYTQFDGNTTMIAIGADLAAKKGIIVVNSAGNEGSSSWHYIVTPADGDSVLAVGAVTSAGIVASFSSYGPSADGQVKPDVASHGQGTTVQFPNNTIGTNNGTSFAAPNMAGLATCLWQGFPEFNNMKIVNAIRLAGSIASAPNDRIGYGIPDMKKATMILLKQFATANATLSQTNCRTTINWTSKDVSPMKYEIERMGSGQTSFTRVGQQQGTGTSFPAGSTYQFIDGLTGMQAGTVTYRIRQILDTSVSGLFADYIDTVTVSLAASCIATGVTTVPVDNNGILLLPNPARDQFTLSINGPAISRLLIKIYNEKGQLVSVSERSKINGPAHFDLSISHFARGKYYVSMYNGTKLLATKELIKL
jgi:serine protease AprX